MNPRLVKRPAHDPVDLDTFLRHAKLDVAEADVVDCQLKLAAAIGIIQDRTGRDRLIESTWELPLLCFPGCDYIELPIPQVQSVSAITYQPQGLEPLTMPASDYILIGNYSPVPDEEDEGQNDQTTLTAYVVLKNGKYWPSVTLEAGWPVTLTFIAGWRHPRNVPAPLKAAICMRARHLYMNRESVTIGDHSRELVYGEDDALRPYRGLRGY